MLIESQASNIGDVGYPDLPEFLQKFHGDTYFMYSSTSIVCDADKRFKEFMLARGFDTVPTRCGVMTKDVHTIVDKWPLRLVKEPEIGGKEDFRAVLAGSGAWGLERYVEWKRTN